MNPSHSDESARTSPSSGEPLSLAQLLALARAGAVDAQRTALEQGPRGEAAVATPEGDPYLRFTCADIACAASLTHFREVLPTLPTTVALPFSPPWMLGLFALHSELIGLVDLAPLLFDAPDLVGLSRARTHNGRVIIPGSQKSSSENWRLAAPESGPTALVIGSGERMLALAVSGVGNLAYVQPGEIRDDAAEISPRAPAERFRAGVLTQPDGRSVSHIVKIDVLLDELLTALTSVEAAAHE